LPGSDAPRFWARRHRKILVVAGVFFLLVLLGAVQDARAALPNDLGDTTPNSSPTIDNYAPVAGGWPIWAFKYTTTSDTPQRVGTANFHCAGNVDVKVAVFTAASSSLPGTLLGTQVVHCPTSEGWASASWSGTLNLTASTDYFVGVIMQSGVTSDYVSPGYTMARKSTIPGSYASPSNWGSADSTGTGGFALYLTMVAAIPANSVLPAISGTATRGQTMTTDSGTWTGSPSSYGYQWQRCNASGGSCVDIAGRTSTTYVLVAADVGNTVRSAVTATNGGGTASAVYSAVSGTTRERGHQRQMPHLG